MQVPTNFPSDTCLGLVSLTQHAACLLPGKGGKPFNALVWFCPGASVFGELNISWASLLSPSEVRGCGPSNRSIFCDDQGLKYSIISSECCNHREIYPCL